LAGFFSPFNFSKFSIFKLKHENVKIKKTLEHRFRWKDQVLDYKSIS
jgi:hypothetical protein